MPRVATVVAHTSTGCGWLPWSLRCWRRWWSSTSRRRWGPLSLARLLLRTRWVLLRPLLVLLWSRLELLGSLLWRPVLLLLLRRLEARTSVAARSNWSDLPLPILQLTVLTLRIERAVNQVVEVVEAEVDQRVLEVVLKAIHEELPLITVIGDVSRGVASELKETIAVLRDRHGSLS